MAPGDPTDIRAALRAAIEDAPEDDLPRLAYADWLEENGDPERAEFIRVQIELARGGLSEERRVGLRSRERELLLAHRPRWDAELPAGLAAGCDYERGFARYRGPTGPLAEAAPPEEPALAFAGEIDWFDIRALFPHLTPLRRSRAPGLRIPGPWLAQFLSAHDLSRLRGLDVGDHEGHESGALGDEDCASLANAPGLAGLTALVLHGNDLTVAGLEALAASPYLTSLKTLHVAMSPANWGEGPNRLFNQGVAALAASPNLRSLRYLGLVDSSGSDWQGVGAAGVCGLVTSPHLTQLERLELKLVPDLPIPLRAALDRRFAGKLALRPASGQQAQTVAAVWSAVCQSPADDAPRLAYADWLSALAQKGGPDWWGSCEPTDPLIIWAPGERAELIRAQCRLAHLAPDHPDRAGLEGWIAALLADGQVGAATNEEAWRAELPLPKGLTWGAFARGFVAEARGERVAALVRWLPLAVLLTPLELVTLEGPLDGGGAEALASLPLPPTIHALALAGDVSEAAAEVLVQAPALSGLRTLNVRRGRLSAVTRGMLAGRFPDLLG
jgi:uncharacterized protein (TIGR02996 family)